MAGCPLLAQNGHPTIAPQCPLLGVKRTSRSDRAMSAFDPKRTLCGQFCCNAQYLSFDVVGYRPRGDSLMRRREFVTLIGAAATWPITTRAQQAEQIARIGFLGTD